MPRRRRAFSGECVDLTRVDCDAVRASAVAMLVFAPDYPDGPAFRMMQGLDADLEGDGIAARGGHDDDDGGVNFRSSTDADAEDDALYMDDHGNDTRRGAVVGASADAAAVSGADDAATTGAAGGVGRGRGRRMLAGVVDEHRDTATGRMYSVASLPSLAELEARIAAATADPAKRATLRRQADAEAKALAQLAAIKAGTGVLPDEIVFGAPEDDADGGDTHRHQQRHRVAVSCPAASEKKAAKRQQLATSSPMQVGDDNTAATAATAAATTTTAVAYTAAQQRVVAFVGSLPLLLGGDMPGAAVILHRCARLERAVNARLVQQAAAAAASRAPHFTMSASSGGGAAVAAALRRQQDAELDDDLRELLGEVGIEPFEIAPLALPTRGDVGHRGGQAAPRTTADTTTAISYGDAEVADAESAQHASPSSSRRRARRRRRNVNCSGGDLFYMTRVADLVAHAETLGQVALEELSERCCRVVLNRSEVVARPDERPAQRWWNFVVAAAGSDRAPRRADDDDDDAVARFFFDMSEAASAPCEPHRARRGATTAGAPTGIVPIVAPQRRGSCAPAAAPSAQGAAGSKRPQQQAPQQWTPVSDLLRDSKARRPALAAPATTTAASAATLSHDARDDDSQLSGLDDAIVVYFHAGLWKRLLVAASVGASRAAEVAAMAATATSATTATTASATTATAAAAGASSLASASAEFATLVAPSDALLALAEDRRRMDALAGAAIAAASGADTRALASFAALYGKAGGATGSKTPRSVAKRVAA